MIEFRHVHCNHRGEKELEITYTIDEEGNLHELMQAFRSFLLAVGYQPGSIDEYIEAD